MTPLQSAQAYLLDVEHELAAAQERIKRLEEENDAMRADLLLWREDKWRE